MVGRYTRGESAGSALRNLLLFPCISRSGYSETSGRRAYPRACGLCRAASWALGTPLANLNSHSQIRKDWRRK